MGDDESLQCYTLGREDGGGEERADTLPPTPSLLPRSSGPLPGLQALSLSPSLSSSSLTPSTFLCCSLSHSLSLPIRFSVAPRGLIYGCGSYRNTGKAAHARHRFVSLLACWLARWLDGCKEAVCVHVNVLYVCCLKAKMFFFSPVSLFFLQTGCSSCCLLLVANVSPTSCMVLLSFQRHWKMMA